MAFLKGKYFKYELHNVNTQRDGFIAPLLRVQLQVNDRRSRLHQAISSIVTEQHEKYTSIQL